MTSPNSAESLDAKAIEELERLEQAATPGDWTRLEGSWLVVQQGDMQGGFDGQFVAECEEDGKWDATIGAKQKQWAGNAELIVAMKNALPELIRLARLGMRAGAFLREHGGAVSMALGKFEGSLRDEDRACEAATALTELRLALKSEPPADREGA